MTRQILYILFTCFLALSVQVPGFAVENDSIDWSNMDLTGEYYKKSFFTKGTSYTLGGIGVAGAGAAAYFLLSGNKDDIIEATDDQFLSSCSQALVMDVLINDKGKNLQITGLKNVPNGIDILIGANGVLETDNVGGTSFSFEYTIEDDQLRTSTAKVSVSVDGPLYKLENDQYSIRSDENVGANVFDNDIGEALKIISNTTGVGGELVLASNGDFSFNPDPDLCGDYTFIYTAQDVCLRAAQAEVVITILDEESPVIQCANDVTISCSESSDPATTGSPTVTDNCNQQATLTYIDQITEGNCKGESTILRKWTATDVSGNIDTCSQVIEIVDTEPPVITCPDAVSISCEDTTDPSATGMATATDNCSALADIVVTYTDDFTNQNGCNSTGQILRKWTATDACGNSSECVQTIAISDNVAPSMTCPAPLTVGCDNGINPKLTGEPSAIDNCTPGELLKFSYTDIIEGKIDCSGYGTVTRTWLVEDLCGNVSSCVQIINVEPINGPKIICPGDLTIGCDESLEPSNTGVATATTDCQKPGEIAITYQDNFTGQTGCNGTGALVRTWIATDPCGVSSTCRQVITITDSEPPVINCPGDIVISCEESSAPASTGLPETSDNCTPRDKMVVSYKDDLSKLTGCNGTGSITRTWTATDLCGQSAVCTQTIAIRDEKVPVIVCAADVTISCEESLNPTNTGRPVVSDNCSSVSELKVTYADDVSGLNKCGGTGVVKRTWTVEDACGFKSTCTQNITIQDTKVPKLTCPAEIIISCDQDPSPSLTGQPTVSDNCSGGSDLTLTYSDDLSGLTGCGGTGILRRTWKATDACGNSTTCIQNIRIRDQTAPVITCVADAVISCNESTGPANTGFPTVTDNCSAPSDIILEYSDSPAILTGCNGTGQILRTWTATDACGNSKVCVQRIDVVDNTPPVLSCPPSITITCDQSTAPATTGSPQVTDNCSTSSSIIVSYSDVVSGALDCSSDGSIIRTWRAVDACGNTSTCLQTITVKKIDAPLIACPPDITVSCNESVDPANTGRPTASTACTKAGELAISYTDNASLTGCNGTGVIERTWKVIDPCGLSSTCIQVITIDDKVPPVVNCPANITVRCDGGFDPSITGQATVSDNCSVQGDIQLTYTDVTSGPLDCTGTGTITRTWRAEDLCGNISVCVQVITVISVDAPVITCPPNVTIGCTASTEPSNTGRPTVSATCNLPGEIKIEYSDNLSQLTGCSGTGFIIRTWKATDPCGKSSTCDQRITIQDVTPPTLSCPAAVTIGCEADISPAALGSATANDNCTPQSAITITYSDNATGLIGCGGTGFINRTWKATDACGNSSSCVQKITIVDNTPPVLACPPSITIRCDQSSSPSVTGQAAASDNCSSAGQIVITYSDAVTGPNNCSGVTTITRTWRAVDACGNASTCTQRITKQLIEGPTVNCPPNITIGCNASTAPSNTGTATATTTCASPGEIVITYTDVTIDAGNCNGKIERTWKATDPCGNSSTCVQTITIKDTSAPVIKCPANATVSCSTQPTPQVTGTATATDDCTATNAITITYQDNIVNTSTCSGLIERTWSAKDACGNISTCLQRITIVDNTAPSLSCPAPITINCEASTDPSNTGQATATDNCSSGPDLKISYTDVVTSFGQCTINGRIVRTWKATDACGNTVSCVQNITIQDSEPPTIQCPANITINCGDSPAPEMTGFATAVDNCSANSNISITYTDNNTGLTGCSGTGSFTRTWKATDACGNVATCVQTITITDKEKPVIACPPSVRIRCDESTDPASTGVPVAIDNCTPANQLTVTYFDIRQGAVGCEGTARILRFWSAFDKCGNSGDCVQIIDIDPTAKPTINCPPDITISCSVSPDPAVTGRPTASTECNLPGEVVLTYLDNASGLTGCNNTGTLIRTWTATDPCGRTNTCIQNINIEDKTNPTLTVPAGTTVSCSGNLPASYGSYSALLSAGGSATDNCGLNTGSLTLVSQVSDGKTCPEKITRTYRIADQCGNTATTTQTFTIDDNTNPALTLPAGTTVSCTGNLPAAYANFAALTAAGGSASDNCGLNTGSFALVSQVSDGQTCPEKITRTYRIADNCGNIVSASQIFTIDDNINPVLTVPSGLTVSCIGAVPPAYANYAGLTAAGGSATDNCGIVSATFKLVSQVSDGNTCPQKITRTYSIADACGNVATAAQVWTVNDQVNPTMTVPAGTTVSCISNLPASYGNYAALTAAGGNAADNCGINQSSFILVSQTSNGQSCPELITRTYRIADLCGNTVTATQTFTVDDNTNPTLSLPAGTTVSCIANLPPSYGSYSALTSAGGSANDNCGINTSSFAFVSQVSDGNTCPEKITRTYRIADQCGNTVTATQVFTVDDNTNPTLSLPAGTTVSCAGQLPATYANYAALTSAGGSASDNCGLNTGSFTLVNQVSDGNSCPEKVTRTYRIADLCGNTVTSTQVFTIDDNINPVLTLPAGTTASCITDLPAAYANYAGLTAAGGSATDNCGIVSATFKLVSQVSDGNTCPQKITRTYSIADACGNVATAAQVWTVNDQVNPTMTVPAGTTVSCISNLPASYGNYAALTAAGGNAADNCGINQSSFTLVSQTSNGQSCPELITRTYRIADLCGNTVTATQTFTVDDNTNPTLSLPAGTTVSCIANLPPSYGSYSALTSAGGSANDNCGINTSSFTFVSQVSDGNTCPEKITRTYRIADQCGNTVTATQVFTVDDNTNPTLSLPAGTTVSCAGQLPASYANYAALTSAGGSASDNCGLNTGSFTLLNQVSDGNSCPEKITRTYRIADLCGNTVTSTQVFTIDDNINPVLTLPAGTTASCITGLPAAYANYAGLTAAGGSATDNCGINTSSFALVSQVVNSGICPYTVVRTYRIGDLCNNQVTANQTFTVNDNIKPVLSGVPANITVSCNGIPSPATVTATDNCDASPSVQLSEVKTPLSCANAYILTRTWTATDNCNNSVSASQAITVTDLVAPVINCPVAKTINCLDSRLPANTGQATASDACAGVIVPTYTDVVSGGADNCTSILTITRTWRATDPCGNTSSCVQIITVNPISGPTITCPADVVISCSASTVPANTGSATAVNPACSTPGEMAISHTDDNANLNNCGGYILRTWRAEDPCGLVSTCVQKITLQDTEAPVLSGVPANVGYSCSATIPTPPTVTATDNCDSNVPVTFSEGAPVVGACANAYTITRTWTAKDDCNNEVSKSQVITVTDNTVPSITCPANVTVTCGDDLSPDVLGYATATDNCSTSDAITITYSDEAKLNQCGGTGVVERIWTAEDACGNSVSCVQSITIEDKTGPVLTCPPDILLTCSESTDPVNTGIATATDACTAMDVITITSSDVTSGVFDCSGIGTIKRTWTATDECGNQTVCVQTITIQQLVCPPAITINCDDNTDPANTGRPKAETNCATPGIKITYKDDSTGITGCGKTGTIVRSWSMRDSCGTELSCTQDIIVEDVSDPVITCPGDVTILCTDSADPANTGSPTATDNCSALFTYTYEDDSLDFSGCAGTIERTWVVKDECDNTDTCVQVITVQEGSGLRIAGDVGQGEEGEQFVEFVDPVLGISMNSIDYNIYSRYFIRLELGSAGKWLNPTLASVMGQGLAGDTQTVGWYGSAQLRRYFGQGKFSPFAGAGLIWKSMIDTQYTMNDMLQVKYTYSIMQQTNKDFDLHSVYISGGVVWRINERFAYELEMRLDNQLNLDDRRSMGLRPGLNTRLIYLIRSQKGD